MKSFWKKALVFGALILTLGSFSFAQAHEVYVLDNTEIAHDISEPALNLWDVITQHEHQFLVWSIFGFLALLAILGISISRRIEKWIDPFLLKIKPYAGHIAQATIGCGLLASAYYGALFGTELPLAQLFGSYAGFATALLYVASAMIIFGIYPRIGAVLGIGIFVGASVHTGVYMISYATYFGEALVLWVFGGSYALLGHRNAGKAHSRIFKFIEKRKSFILRVFFSMSLIYAALYAKLIHGSLALDTVNKYHLTNYFHFDPLFIVLGAFLVEMMIGLFYLIGFEVRFTSLLFLTFITLSLCFFGETVWPHIILLGTAIAMFVHGYDEFTVERVWYKKNKYEPVL